MGKHRSFEWYRAYTVDDSLYDLSAKWGPKCTLRDICPMAISPQRVIRIRSISCLVLGYRFLSRRIEWHYFRFDHTQDGGHGHAYHVMVR